MEKRPVATEVIMLIEKGHGFLTRWRRVRLNDDILSDTPLIGCMEEVCSGPTKVLGGCGEDLAHGVAVHFWVKMAVAERNAFIPKSEKRPYKRV